MSGRVLVVGDVMTDIIVKPDGPIVPGSDRRAEIRNKPGGSGANQAVWLGAAGVDVLFAARVGAAEKDFYENYFRGLDVVPALSGDKDLPTGVLVTLLDSSGERSFLTDRGANLNLGNGDLTPDLLDHIALVMVSGYTFFAPGPRRAVCALLAEARARDIAIAIDPASVGFLEEVGPQAFLGWVGGADWLFANEGEAELLSGSADLETQMRQLSRHFGQVVIKRGRFGAILGGSEGVTCSAPAPVVPVVDTTGAGDAFAAGFVAAMLAGALPQARLEAGIAEGAKAVQMLGGQPG